MRGVQGREIAKIPREFTTNSPSCGAARYIVASDMLRFMDRLKRCPGASVAAIAVAEEKLSKRLPADYLEFIKTANGAEGFIGQSAYMILWAIEELDPMNRAYETQDHAPGLLIFGSNGGGEAYGFDIRRSDWPVVQIPFVGMNWNSASQIGESFSVFLRGLYDSGKKSRTGARDWPSPVAEGKEIFEITPVILGGSPTDPANKTFLSRDKHIEAVTFWNKFISRLRVKPASKR
jgi:hypothetical protein